MATLLRRMFWLALLGGGAYGGWSWWSRNRAAHPDAAPAWPPFDPDTGATSTDAGADTARVAAAVPIAGVASTAAAPEQRAWVEPIDGACPDGYPIKANDNSGIYHVPGGRFYERTAPERCYATAEGAEADGYRAAKA